MTTYRLAEAAELLGVSDDTVRRWIDAGRVPAGTDAGRAVIAGADLAALARSLADGPESRAGAVSARNRFGGLVVEVRRDGVMAQVDMVCGAHRVVSLMSREAADELDLQPGSRVVASVKSTSVVVETA